MKNFIKIRSIPPKNPKFQQSLDDISRDLEQAHATLTKVHNRKGLAWDEFIASLTIILREGIEAFLIIAALLAIIGSSKNIRARELFIYLGSVHSLLEL